MPDSRRKPAAGQTGIKQGRSLIYASKYDGMIVFLGLILIGIRAFVQWSIAMNVNNKITNLLDQIMNDGRFTVEYRQEIINYANECATTPKSWIEHAERSYHEYLEMASRKGLTERKLT
jgi:hypothetical protein